MFRKLTLLSVFLTLIMVMLGALIRVADVDLSGLNPEVMLFLKGPGHQYLTATLAGLVVLLAGLSAWQKTAKVATLVNCVFVLLLVGAQGALGFWAQALITMPFIITGHVLLGLLTFWGLFSVYLRANPAISGDLTELSSVRWRLVWLTRFAMLALVVQIVLGVWVSANHADLVCVGFPQCNGQWWPQADYATALDLTRGLITGYTGVISYDAQVAANELHKVSAILVFLLLSAVLFTATQTKSSAAVKTAGLWLGGLLFVLIGLAILAIKLALPLVVAPIHEGLAALLMLPLLAISFYSRYAGFEAFVPADKITDKPAVRTVDVPLSATTTLEAPYEEPLPESLYLRLKSQLKRTRSGLGGLLANLPLGQSAITDDLLEEIEANLLMADVGVDATTEIIRRLTKRLERHQLTDGEALSTALKAELLSILKPCNIPLEIPKQDTPFVILVVGVNGAGKTTTIGKLANRLQAQGHSVMLAAGDTFRAAAVEQLQVWGERNGIQVVAQHTGADSASVIYDGLQSAKAKGIDVLIADTAGRLQTKSNLMEELRKVKRIMGKLDESAPHEVLLVLDAGTGQNALSQAKIFNETVALTGLALTKLDGTAKGGVIFALAKHTGLPIRFIGIGEGIEDLQDFDAELFVDALFVKD